MWRYTVERSPTSVASAIVHPLKHVIWENIWERTVARSPTSVTSVCVCMLPSFCCWKLVCLVCDQEIPTTTTTKKLCLFNNKKELFFEKGDGIVVALYLGHKALDTSLLSAIVNQFSFYSRIPVGPSEDCQPLFCFSVETMSLVPPIRTAHLELSMKAHFSSLCLSCQQSSAAVAMLF